MWSNKFKYSWNNCFHPLSSSYLYHFKCCTKVLNFPRNYNILLHLKNKLSYRKIYNMYHKQEIIHQDPKHIQMKQQDHKLNRQYYFLFSNQHHYLNSNRFRLYHLLSLLSFHHMLRTIQMHSCSMILHLECHKVTNKCNWACNKLLVLWNYRDCPCLDSMTFNRLCSTG